MTQLDEYGRPLIGAAGSGSHPPRAAGAFEFLHRIA